ncbi:MAG: universal stress protein [Actinomycetota bacterium]|nr:universal stress protein [Actinomycetota bacterium]
MNFFPKKILLATDDSDDARLAAEAAVDLSNETGSELHVVYVALTSPWMTPDAMNPGEAERLREQAQRVLDKQVRWVEEKGGTITEAHLETGYKASHEIIRLAEEINAGIIVVGSRGLGAVERILLGDDSESVVRHAPCPVLVVREQK